MPMRIAILGTPDSWYTRDLARAAGTRHEISVLSFRDLGSRLGSSTTVSAGAADLRHFDALLVRTMPPGSLEQVVFRMDLLARLQALGTPVVSSASDDDLRAMALSLSKLPPPAPVTGSMNMERMERARALIEQNRCNFCHQKNYAGEENVPRLAGQREDYLVKAMREYKNNTRRGYDASMADVLFPISDEQLRDLAYFLARLR